MSAAETDPRTVLAAARAALRDGDPEAAMACLRPLVGRGDVDPLAAHRAGSLLMRALGSREPGLRVLVAGSCTLTWLVPVLVAAAWADGETLAASEGGFDTVVQDLERAAATAEALDAVVLVPWLREPAQDRVSVLADRIDAELATWRLAWRLAHERLGARVVQLGYDWVSPGPAGFLQSGAPDGGPVAGARRLNEALHHALAEALPSASAFVDVPLIAGEMGRQRFYDPRRWAWTRQPWSEAGAVFLARHLWAAIRAVCRGPKKLLVLDLDDTLWGGVVGEVGGRGVELGDSPAGEAFRLFQTYCQGLARRGVVLAVASKNNPEDARAPFLEHPDMVLGLGDFAAFEASWAPKDQVIREVAARLRLGLEHVVFFDDNPAERALVRRALPQVQVIDVPDDPSGYVAALVASLAFETASITDEDRLRAADYRAQQQRAPSAAHDGATSLSEHLVALAMVGEVRDVDDADMARVVQLLGKTNQWNLTTRRHGEAQIRALLARPRAIGLTLRLEDRYGPSGLVAVLFGVPDEADPEVLVIDSWLMSCRVIGRTAEHFLFHALVERARDLGYRTLRGERIPSAKNAVVADLYPSLGFSTVPASSPVRGFSLSLVEARLPWTAIRAGGSG